MSSVALPAAGRKVAVVAAWVGAAFVFVGGLAAMWHALTFPSALARHPVRTNATVIDSFINGLGGDPAIDYRYTVDGRVYDGWGTGGRGYPDLLSLKLGDSLPIQYAKTEPSKSCMCDAKKEASSAAGFGVAAAFLVPLSYLLTRRLRRRRRGVGALAA
jgi:hypothetical protein